VNAIRSQEIQDGIKLLCVNHDPLLAKLAAHRVLTIPVGFVTLRARRFS
jgi:hypothetical protein